MGPKPACFGAFSTTFRFPKSELPSTHGHTNAKSIPILENFRRSDQNVYFGEPISGKMEIHTKTQKCTYFGENIYFLQEKKNMFFISEKSAHMREKW